MHSENDKKNNKKILIIMILSISILVVGVFGISYSLWKRVFIGEKENIISTGIRDGGDDSDTNSVTNEYLSFNYTESEENVISIDNAVPITDENGKKLKGKNNVFDFSISAKYNVAGTLYYEIYATPVKNSLSEKYIKVYLTDQNDNPIGIYKNSIPKYSELSTSSFDNSSKILHTGTLKSSENKNLRLRVWIDYDYSETDESKEFSFKVNVNSYIK